MPYKRPTSMYDALMSGLNNLSNVGPMINDSRRTQAALKSADLDNQVQEQKIAQEKLSTQQAQQKALLLDSFHKAQDARMDIPVGVRNETPTDNEMKLWARVQDKPIEEVRANLAGVQGQAKQIDLGNQAKAQDIDFNKNLMPIQLQGEKLKNEKTAADIENGRYAPVQIVVDGVPQIAGFSGKDATVKRSGEEAVPKLNGGKSAADKRDEAIFKAKDKLREAYEKTGTGNAIIMLNDIAGKIGGVDGKGDIEGYGAGGKKPEAFLSDQGKAIRTSLAGLRNIVLKDRSGAAVSNQEFDRLKEEIGGGFWSTDADLRSKLKRMGEIVAQHAKDIDATFDGDPDVPREAFEQYRKAGGTTGASLSMNPGAAAPAAVAVSPEKKALAQQALNDPAATEEDKAQARKILGM